MVLQCFCDVLMCLFKQKTADDMLISDWSADVCSSDLLGGGGDFAYAYVIAHEVGHHVQNLTGVFARAQQARQQGAQMNGADGLSVRQELQADCYAGVWANRAQTRHHWLEQGDVESALNTATAIGDDRLQQQEIGRAHV